MALYIDDNDNNKTFVGYCLFVALIVSFAPSLCSGANDVTRATNKQYPSKSLVIVLLSLSTVGYSTVSKYKIY